MLAVLKSIAGSIPGHRYDLKMLPGGRAVALILKNPEDKKLAVEAIEREPALRLGGLKKARRELILLGVNSDIKEETLREMVLLQNSGCGDFLKGYMRLYPKSTRRPYATNWVISGLKEATMKSLLGKERLKRVHQGRLTGLRSSLFGLWVLGGGGACTERGGVSKTGLPLYVHTTSEQRPQAVSGKIRCSANLRLLEGEDEFKTRDLKETRDLILDRHFGNEEPEDEISLTTCGLVDPPFSENEVKLTAFKFGKRKSPGPDGIYNTVVKALVRMHPSLPARLFNRCLDTGTFPEAWKVARVVLLEKSGRKGNSPNDYRPLSLLVCLGKVLDSPLAQRLKHWLEINELLSSFQHGFREGKSTTTSLNEVLEGVEMGLNKGAWVLLVALDIDGAFNSMSWNKLMRNLMDMGCPDYLCSLVRDFPRDRRISLSFGGRKLERICARGCPQGSCCGRILWNILVNTVFQEELPEGARLVLYAEDQFLIIEAASRAKTEKAWWRRNRDQKVATTLERVQRTAALRFTGGYLTTSSETLLVLAEIIPLGLKLEEETIRQKIWENREDALGLEAGALEWNRDPRKPPQRFPKCNWSTGVPTGIGTEVFTDGRESGTNTGAGVVIFTNGELIFQESLTLRVDELVFSAELVAIRKALRVCAEKNFSPDRLYSDCMSAFVAINLQKGQLAHQIIQELEMMTRVPELPWFRGHSLIEDPGTPFYSRQDKEMELNQDQDIMELNQDPIGVKSDGPTETTTEGRQEVRETGETTAPLADAVNQLSALLTRVKISDGAESAIPPFDGTYNATQFFQAFDRKMEDASMGEQEKLLRLPNYLARQPLELFRKLRMADRSYFQVRQILLDLYPESSEASFAKYFAMKLPGQANLETYYREKTAMGLQLGLPQEVILETLTEGLPFNDQRLVRVVPPENLGEWFRLVQRIHGPSVPTTRPREDQPPTMSGPYHSTPRRPGAWNAPLPPSNCKFCGARHWHSECRRRPVPTTHEKVRTVQTVPKSPVPIPQQPTNCLFYMPSNNQTTTTSTYEPVQNAPTQRDNSHTKNIGDHTPLHNSHMTNPHNELDTHTNTQQNPLPHAYYNTTPNTHYTPQFTTLLQRYTHIFSQDKFNLPCLRIPPVKIPTNSEKIITIRPYRVPICDQQEIRNQIQQMLENGIIEQSFSPFSSPVTLVTKRDKTKRFCIDYRKVNELISSDVHPLPRIEDILDRLAQAKYFSTADISSAYWQVPIHHDSRPLLAFATFEGLCQPTRLPFGLKTSPQIYERAISQVLQRHGHDCVAHYFDDFIIYSNTLEEYQNHLRQFFAFCEAEKLQLNFVKCESFKQSIDFLGYTITAGTITPLTRNTDIIHAIKQPHNRKTLQSFLGAVNVYNKFIPEYARLRAPLNNLLKKDVVWNWNEVCQKAFIDLKGNLTQHPILHLYKEGLPCQVYCDASTLGIAGILKQVHPDGNVYPVQYFSRTLRPHEKNYSISELECLAIVESVEKFRIYLMGRKFTIFSDHHALQWLKTIKNPSGRLFRWSLRLSSYEYEVRYIKGKLQYEADLLSGNPFCGFLDATLIKTHQPPPSKESTLTIDRNGLHTVSRKGVTKIILPKPLIQQLLQTVHTQYNHPGISQMSRIISTQYYWQGMSKDIKQKVKTCPTCQLTKRPVGPTYGELSQPPESKEPFDLLSLDTIAGFAKYGNTKIYLHVVVDHFSRYAWAFPSKSTSTTTYQQVLKRVFQDGSPKRLLTDRAPAFTSPKFRSFLLNRNIHPLITTSNNPQANGLCERLNATLTGKLRLLHLENPKVAWTKLVKRVTIIYNKTPHSTTGFPPIYLMFGILPPEISNHNTPYPDIDKARKIAHTRTQNKHLQDKNIYDQRHKQPHFEVGDLVLVKLYHHPNTGKLAPYFTGPHTILEIISPNVVRIDRPNQPLQRDTDTIHVNKLKLYTEKIRYISPPAVSTYHIKHNPNYTFPFKHLTPELFPTESLRFKPTSSEPFRHLDPAIFATRRFASLFPDVKNCKPDNQLNHITPLPKDIKQENCEPTNHSNSTINKVQANISESPVTKIWTNMGQYPIFHLIFILCLMVETRSGKMQDPAQERIKAEESAKPQPGATIGRDASSDPVVLNPNIDIPKYDGTEDPRPWIESLEEIGFLYHWADYIISRYAAMNMIGSAKTWLNLHKVSFTSWENFKSRLIEDFASDANKEEMRMRLNRIQQWNEPAIRFAEDILVLCNKVDPQMEEETKINWVIGGLKKEYSFALHLNPPKNTNELLEFCKKLDLFEKNYQERAEKSKALYNGPRSPRPHHQEQWKNATSFRRPYQNTSKPQAPAPRYYQNTSKPQAPTPRYYQNKPLPQVSAPRRSYTPNPEPKPVYPSKTYNKNPNSNRNRTEDGRPICFKCNKPGHVARYCRVRFVRIVEEDPIVTQDKVEEEIRMDNGTQKSRPLLYSDPAEVNLMEESEQKEHEEPQFQINENLAYKEKEQLKQVLERYEDLFSSGLGRSNLAKHRIDTEGAKPIKHKPYRVSAKEREIIKEQIDEMLRDGIIRPSSSPWSFPVILVKKRDGKYRFCVDYRKLNDVTVKDVYPIPRIDEVLDTLQGSKYFSAIDLKSGYWQVEVEEKDKEKTAFTTAHGLYEFNVMPFGLCNAPATFERNMENMLGNLRWQICLCYLDDVIIYSSDFSTHLKRIEAVLKCFREANLKLNNKKCQFAFEELEILGHITNQHGIKPAEHNIKAIRDFPRPKKIKEVQSFLGMCSYYRKFIKGFSKIADPLTSLIKKNVPFTWTENQEKAFQTLKVALINPPILGHFDPNAITYIHTDASNIGLGATLVQKFGDKEKVISYLSRTLSKPEQNYSTTEKECLAVVWSMSKLRPYLYGRHFKIVTDHHALCWLKNLKDPTGRLARWALKIQEYNFEIIHKSGKKHLDADGLSRGPLPENEWDEDYERLFLNQIIDEKDDFIENIKENLSGNKRSITQNFKEENGCLYKKNPNPEEFVKTCHLCQSQKGSNHLPSGLLQPIPPANYPFERIGIDFVGPLPSTKRRRKWIIVLTDYYTKYAETKAVSEATVKEVSTFLIEHIILRHGAPRFLISDRGSQFTSNLMKEVMKMCKVKHCFTTSYHPQTNGLTERLNRTLINMISMYVNTDQKNWDEILPFITHAYNTTIQETTGYSPFFLLFGREPMSLLDDENIPTDSNMDDYDEYIENYLDKIARTRQVVINNTEKTQERMKRNYDKKHNEKIYEPGHLVAVWTPVRKIGKCEKLLRKYFGPYRILKKLSNVNYLIEPKDNPGQDPLIVHVSRLKPYFERIDEVTHED
ncbi:hypothetical protein LAZ67_4003240, partial [Cordylochernes scorpioides]